jgi:hypothetical protein
VAYLAVYHQCVGVTHVAFEQHNPGERVDGTIKNIDERKGPISPGEENGMGARSDPAGEIPNIGTIRTGDMRQKQTNDGTEHKQSLRYHHSSSSN